VIASPPNVTDADVRRCLRELPDQGRELPVPERVEVIADEDSAGDQVFRMTVVFPVSAGIEEAAWKVVNPLLIKLRALVGERTGYERPVLTEIRRLAEESNS
jgi:hypothetical protein